MTDDSSEKFDKTERGLAIIKGIELQIGELKALNLDSSHQMFIRDVQTSLNVLSFRLQRSIKKREQSQEAKHSKSRSIKR